MRGPYYFDQILVGKGRIGQIDQIPNSFPVRDKLVRIRRIEVPKVPMLP